MSTKAIRKALMMMKMDPMSQDFDDRPAYTAALAEVEAIEAMAKVLCTPTLPANDRRKVAELMKSIAKDAP